MTRPRRTSARAPLVLLTGACVLLCLQAAASAAEPANREVIRLDETVISGNQELPKVLYIVPWQSPEGLPDMEIAADFPEADLFRRLYPPAYRRELGYFDQRTNEREE